MPDTKDKEKKDQEQKKEGPETKVEKPQPAKIATRRNAID